MDLVSIIMPYFKKKKYINQAIDSVIKQTYKNFELIIIYDDENKEDLNFLKKIIKKDKRIKLYINKKNLGVGRSRNKGIKLSKGSLIAFLDSDDLWTRNKLKRQIFFMKKNLLDISHTSFHIINSNNKIIFALKNNLTKWRKLDNSLSASKIQKLYDGYLVYRKHMNFGMLKSFICLLSLSFNYVLKELRNK